MNLRSRTLKNRATPRRSQKGLAIVESVIVMPIVLVVMLAVAELGNAVMQYNQLTHAVRHGVRFLASVPNGTGGTANISAADIAAASNLVVYGDLSGGSGPILQGLTTANVVYQDLGGNNISLTVNYGYQPLLASGIPNLIQGGSIGGAFTMRAGVVMRVL